MILHNQPYPRTKNESFVVKLGDDYLISNNDRPDEFEFSIKKEHAFVFSCFEFALHHAEACAGAVVKRFFDGYEARMISFQHP